MPDRKMGASEEGGCAPRLSDIFCVCVRKKEKQTLCWLAHRQRDLLGVSSDTSD